MKKALYGLLALPLLSGVAIAQQAPSAIQRQPLQLTSAQMDHVTAGWDLYELDIGNTSITQVSVYGAGGTLSPCPACVVDMRFGPLKVQSKILGYGG